MEEYTEGNKHFIQLVKKWKVHFALVSVIAIACAVVFSSAWFITPKYKSFAIVYPANIKPYSTESETEQMLQLYRSADVRNSVIQKLHLSEHYAIDTTEKLGLDKLFSTYETNVGINRTQFESIEIAVLDADPKMASDMVEEIINSMNLKARRLQRDKTREVEILTRGELNLKKYKLDSVNNLLYALRTKYHIFNYQMQAKEVIKGYLRGLNSGGRNLKEVEVMMQNLEEKGGEYYEANKALDVLSESYNKTQLDYINVQRDLSKELTYANVITKPCPSYKKAYPTRWLIVLISVVSANLFLFLTIVLIDRKKKQSR